MSYFAEVFTSMMLIIFVWFICIISTKILESCIMIIKKLFNNYNRNTRVSPNYDINIDSSYTNTQNNDYIIIINPQNIVTLGKISD
jgi:hypothetical protein